MARSFKRLGLKEREELAILKAQGKSLRGIAKILGFSHSSLSRELRRLDKAFGRKMRYSPCASNDIARITRKKAGRKKSFKNPLLKSYVEERIKRGWSPELISGRLNRELPDLTVSHETIYQHVYGSGFELLGYLPRRHAFRKPKAKYRKAKASNIPNRLAIDHRPEKANQRIEFGHWESDSVVSGQSRAVLNVLVERMSRYVQISKLPDATSLSTSNAIISRLSTLQKPLRLSITYDNGFENTRHETVNQKLDMKSYFCQPYHSWEKGSVENINGLIRRYIPKKMDIALVTTDQILEIENNLNNRPKKCLDYRTPNEVFNSFLALVQ